MKNKEVSLTQREKDHTLALQDVDLWAETWLDARAQGLVPLKLQDRLDEALQNLKKTSRRLENTERRTHKRVSDWTDKLRDDRRVT